MYIKTQKLQNTKQLTGLIEIIAHID